MMPRRQGEAIRRRQEGLTLAELIIGAMLLAVGIVGLMQMLVQQRTLDEHSRNLSWAINDAVRVMEQLWDQNQNEPTCPPPILTPPVGGDWDTWLETAGGGQSIQPDPATNEYVWVEPLVTVVNPVQVTITMCWRHRERIVGECNWDGTQFTGGLNDANGNGIIGESPATISTILTCRS